MGSVNGSAKEPLRLAHVFGSSTSASESSTSVSEHKDISSRLHGLTKDGVEFSSVQIYQLPVRVGVAQHHSLVYWYQLGRAGGFTMPLTRGLQLDWGSDGLAFTDLYDKPLGTSLTCKECGIRPVTVAHQLAPLINKVYSLVQWNCQHFSSHLYDRACGNSNLNDKLQDMHAAGGVFVSAGIFQEASEDEDRRGEDSTMVYWYQAPDANALHCLRLDWGAAGLSFRISMESPSEEPLDLAGARWRECSVEPDRLLEQLHEIAGWKYEAATWNRNTFAHHLFRNVLAKGGRERLHAHLDDLTERGIEIAGVSDVLSPDPSQRESGDRHMLVYKYKIPDGFQSATVHLSLAWGSRGLHFSESDEEDIAGALLVRTKSMLFIRLRPAELQRQIRSLEGRNYDPVDFSSQHFSDLLFSKAPGKERGVLRATAPQKHSNSRRTSSSKPKANPTIRPARTRDI